MNKRSGGWLKASIVVLFLTGTAAFCIAALSVNDFFAAVCFFCLAFLAMLSSIGIGMADMSESCYWRGSTKLAALTYALSVNGGTLSAILLMQEELEIAALLCVAIASILSVISAYVIIKRYFTDDF